MSNLIKKVPITLSGVMLGIAVLGNLLQSYSEVVRYICGIVSGILCLLIILKTMFYFSDIKDDMKNPIMASVSATFPMGLMLLSVYLKPFIGGAAIGIWFFAIVLHVFIIIYFTYAFMIKLDFKKVFASYFVVYVGIATIGVSAPAYDMQLIGTIAFWVAFVSLVALLVLVTYRYIKHREIPEPARPLICIFTAPASLCLVAYLQSVADKSILIVSCLAILATILYIFVLTRLIPLLKLKFYPSYASFTFPFVISATAMKQTMSYFNNISQPLPFLQYIVLIETIIAILITCYALIRYFIFLLRD